MINDLGFTEQSYYRWIKKDDFHLRDLKKIVNYFGNDINYFFDIEYKPKKNDELNMLEDKIELYQKQIRYLEDHIETLKKHNIELQTHIIKEKPRTESG